MNLRSWFSFGLAVISVSDSSTQAASASLRGELVVAEVVPALLDFAVVETAVDVGVQPVLRDLFRLCRRLLHLLPRRIPNAVFDEIFLFLVIVAATLAPLGFIVDILQEAGVRAGQTRPPLVP